MTNPAFAPFVPSLHTQLNNTTLTPQQVLDEAVVSAATEGLSKEAFQDMFHKNITASYDLQNKAINLTWDFDNGSVGVEFDKHSIMLNFQKAF